MEELENGMEAIDEFTAWIEEEAELQSFQNEF